MTQTVRPFRSSGGALFGPTRCPRILLRLALSMALGFVLACTPEQEEQAETSPKSELSPGTTIRVDDPLTGGLGYWTLTLPADYTPDRRWPVIFNLHALDAEPGPWPFSALAGSQGYVIVGVEYVQRGLEGINRVVEADNLRRVYTMVADKVSIDQSARILGGFSKGGWAASNAAERTSELWDGVVIMGSGRSSTPSADGLKGKPLFIGIGETDGERESAAGAAVFYEQLGAEVTFEVFEGVGHTVGTDNPTLNQWLQDRKAR
jgi:predicted peptidase